MPEQWRWFDREGDDECGCAGGEERRATAETETETTETLSLPWRRLAEKGLRWRVDGVREIPRLCFRARRACAART